METKTFMNVACNLCIGVNVFGIIELIHIGIMALAIGFIFKDIPLFNVIRTSYSGIPIKKGPSSFLLAIYAVVPGIILHELFHKFVAIYFGAFDARFEANFVFLAIAVGLRLIKSPLIIVAPAYVTFSSLGLSGAQMALIGFAGPFANLLLYLSAFIILKYDFKFIRNIKKNPYWYTILVGTRYINGFLFIFNLIPIPGFDGHHIFRGLVGG